VMRDDPALVAVNMTDENGNIIMERPPLTATEAALIRGLPTVADIAIQDQATGSVRFEDVDRSSMPVEGSSASWLSVNGGEMVAGRTFTPAEDAVAARVAVINKKLAEALFGRREPLGKEIKVQGETFRVIGIYVPADAMLGIGDDPRLIIPFGALTKLPGYREGEIRIAVTPTATASVTAAQVDVETVLRASRGLGPDKPDNFAMATQDRLLENFTKITSAFFLTMLALSSLSLLVGGIGVIAVMMIAVTERTREIGIRKALGATRGEIRLQFLTEAATITLAGCVAGLLVGAAIAWGIRTFSPVPATIPPLSVAAALAAAILTGVLFGSYPASRAARLDPVEALRHE